MGIVKTKQAENRGTSNLSGQLMEGLIKFRQSLILLVWAILQLFDIALIALFKQDSS